MAKLKYYAVRVGRTPGIFTDWSMCEQQVKGFTGAIYKKFDTLDEAQVFLTSDNKDFVKSSKENNILLPTDDYAFVDGSYNSETGVYGYGGFVFHNGSRFPLLGNGCDSEMASMHNVAGEILGAMAAVKKAENLGMNNLTILYDYKGIEEWAKCRWKTNKKGTAEYAKFMNAPKRTVKIQFIKVTAHTGVEGNELADIMAKASAGIQLTEKQYAMLTSEYDTLMQEIEG